jgi:MerR family transcriptional regulator/heat shock protein HspR
MADDSLQEEPCYVISVAAKLVQLHPQTLRYYDRIGLIRPSRTAGRIRLYSQRDVETLRKIARLTEDLGVNLAGVEVILNMSRHIEELQQKLDALQRQAEREIAALRARIRELEGGDAWATEPYRIIAPTERPAEGGLQAEADSTQNLEEGEYDR